MSQLSFKKTCKLIELISEQRNLYDRNSRISLKKRTKIWEDIAVICNIKSDQCKKRWINLKKSYDHFVKNGREFTKRTNGKRKLFEKMSFLDVQKKQSNGNQRQNANNVQQGNANQQQGNVNQQQNANNVQQGNANQQQGNGNQQQNANNVQQGNANQQQVNEKNTGPKNENVGKKLPGNETKLDPKTTDGLLKNQHVLRNKSPGKNAVPSVQLNIGGVDTNLGSKRNEETFKPKPQLWPEKKQNDEKSMEDELHSFSTTVRTTLGNLPRELQIQAQDEVFLVLSKYKKLAHSSMSVSESSSKNTE